MNGVARFITSHGGSDQKAAGVLDRTVSEIRCRTPGVVLERCGHHCGRWLSVRSTSTNSRRYVYYIKVYNRMNIGTKVWFGLRQGLHVSPMALE